MNGGGSGAIQRLFDANANRAREALRVLEDYARFVLDHEPLSAELKDLRHRLAAATRPFLPAALLHRDTAGDVGTTITTVAEQHRADLSDVVTAAGKRLGEAVRSLEEYAKTFDPAAAAQLEAIRYRFYTVEQQLARTLRPAGRFAAVRLYVLITGVRLPPPLGAHRRAGHPRRGRRAPAAREDDGRRRAAGPRPPVRRPLPPARRDLDHQRPPRRRRAERSGRRPRRPGRPAGRRRPRGSSAPGRSSASARTRSPTPSVP